MKPAAYLVVNPARRHFGQGELRHLQRRRFAGSGMPPQQKLQRRRLWELGLKPESAGRAVEVVG